MAEKSFNSIFASRLRHYLSVNNMTQRGLAAALHVGTTSVYNWCNGIKTPRMDKIDAMCDLFGCRRSDLMQDVPSIDSNLNLSDQETLLVEYFRQASPEIQQLVLAALHVPEGKNQDSARAV